MNLFSKKRIFMDYAGGKDNPSAIYAEGVRSRRELEEARTSIARILHAGSKDIIFTSGGTEADNLAILGTFEKTKEKINKPHIIISSVEHPAISETAKEVERRGGEVTIVQADEEGLISPQEILNAVKDNTVLISVGLVNGETGTIQPVSKIGRLLREYRKDKNTTLPYLHTDASQAVNLLDLSVESLRVDLMTLDGSKVSGSHGAGCLVVRPNVILYPIIFGGGQERGLRSGTENVSAIVAFAKALTLADKNKEKEYERLNALRKYFIEEIKKNPPAGGPNVIINGSSNPELQLPNIVSISIPNVLAEFMALKLDQKGIMVSVGSACNSRKNLPDKETIRFSFGKFTTKSEIVRALKAL